MALMTTTRDVEFFNAVHELMKNTYPEMTERFGIWRIHQHFELGKDEVFHETSDSEKQESTLRIIKKSNLPQEAYPTTWKLTTQGPVVAEWCCDDASSRPKQ